jgi:hypothetical protein
MNEIETVEITSDDELDMEVKAKEVTQTLTQHYPNHVWMVGWAPGRTLIVRNMLFNAKYGYTIDGTKELSAKELSHAAVCAGGELLERMGMTRGAWDGELPNKMDLAQ